MCVCALSVAWLVPLANYVVWRVIRHCIELVIKGIASFGYYVVKLCFLAFFTLFFVCIRLSLSHAWLSVSGGFSIG